MLLEMPSPFLLCPMFAHLLYDYSINKETEFKDFDLIASIFKVQLISLVLYNLFYEYCNTKKQTVRCQKIL